MNKTEAIKILSKNEEKNVCLIENLKYSDVTFYDIGKGVICFTCNGGSILYLSALRGAKPNLSRLKAKFNCVFTPSLSLAKSIGKTLGKNLCKCAQIIYGKPTHVNNEFTYKVLEETEKNVETIEKTYSLNYTKSEIKELFKTRFFIGAFLNGELCGYIGMHEERSVGMLEVFPDFRRRGVGKELIASAVEEFTKRGFKPFCHIKMINAKSLALHKSIDCKFYKNNVYWLD